jgi:hypothetical protein
MHYRRERNDFVCSNNVERNERNMFQITVFIKLRNFISLCVREVQSLRKVLRIFGSRLIGSRKEVA